MLECFTLEYRSWGQMIQRCTNPNNPVYKHYGGRGIKVCERWRNSYNSFLEDMGRRPTPTHTLDRIKNDLDYCPENYKWSTRKEQSFNRRNTILTKEKVLEIRTLHNEGMSQANIAKKYNLRRDTIYKIVRMKSWKIN